MKENFIVENRAGAGGVIGSDLVAKAAPDGYTLVVSGVATHCIAPALSKASPSIRCAISPTSRSSAARPACWSSTRRCRRRT